MSQFFENPELAEVELADNGSDSEPQAGQLTQSEKNLRKEEFLKVVKSPKLQKTTTKMDDIKNNEIKMARNNVITVNKNSHE